MVVSPATSPPKMSPNNPLSLSSVLGWGREKENVTRRHRVEVLNILRDCRIYEEPLSFIVENLNHGRLRIVKSDWLTIYARFTKAQIYWQEISVKTCHFRFFIPLESNINILNKSLVIFILLFHKRFTSSPFVLPGLLSIRTLLCFPFNSKLK